MRAVMSIDFWRVSGRELAHPTSDLLPAVLWFYRLSCLSLNSLNAMWFYKMLKGAIKVLAGVAPNSCLPLGLTTDVRPLAVHWPG